MESSGAGEILPTEEDRTNDNTLFHSKSTSDKMEDDQAVLQYLVDSTAILRTSLSLPSPQEYYRSKLWFPNIEPYKTSSGKELCLPTRANNTLKTDVNYDWKWLMNGLMNLDVEFPNIGFYPLGSARHKTNTGYRLRLQTIRDYSWTQQNLIPRWTPPEVSDEESRKRQETIAADGGREEDADRDEYPERTLVLMTSPSPARSPAFLLNQLMANRDLFSGDDRGLREIVASLLTNATKDREYPCQFDQEDLDGLTDSDNSPNSCRLSSSSVSSEDSLVDDEEICESSIFAQIAIANSYNLFSIPYIDEICSDDDDIQADLPSSRDMSEDEEWTSSDVRDDHCVLESPIGVDNTDLWMTMEDSFVSPCVLDQNVITYEQFNVDQSEIKDIMNALLDRIEVELQKTQYFDI